MLELSRFCITLATILTKIAIQRAANRRESSKAHDGDVCRKSQLIAQ